MALKEATKEAIYLANMLNYINDKLKLGYSRSVPKILVDSMSAKKLAENPKFHKRSKHIELIYHFTRNAIANNQIELLHVNSKDQLADTLTKCLAIPLHEYHLDLLGLGPIP